MTAQATVDNLKQRIAGFDTQLSELQADIATKRTEAGSAMLEGRDTSRLEDVIARLMSRLSIVQSGMDEAKRRLPEALAALAAERKEKAQERMQRLRVEVDEAAVDLERLLQSTQEAAIHFEQLIADANKFSKAEDIQLRIGSWVNLGWGSGIVVPLRQIISLFISYKPKAKG